MEENDEEESALSVCSGTNARRCVIATERTDEGQ